MIIRIVEFKFRPDAVDTFLILFNHWKEEMISFDGCLELELLKDPADPQSFVTYAVWESEEHINKYCFSGFFKEVWAKTRVLFSDFPKTRNLVIANSAVRKISTDTAI